MALNARLGEADPAGLTESARTADVLVLTEATAPQVRALTAAGLIDRFPHRNAGRLPAAGAGGTAVFSRYPLTSTAALSPELANQAWSCQVATCPGPRARRLALRRRRGGRGLGADLPGGLEHGPAAGTDHLGLLVTVAVTARR